MKVYSRAAHTDQKMPATQVHNLLDGQLALFVRSWGSSEYNQKFVDEISHYLSSTQADLDVTTPFEYQENLSSLANRTRVALLLAHDLFLKNENRSEYTVGFEVAVLFKSKNELAWSSVGRFSLDRINGESLHRLMGNGSDLDSEALLPVQLLGVERSVDISSGAALFSAQSRFLLSSTYNCELEMQNEEPVETGVSGGHGTYWFSVLTDG